QRKISFSSRWGQRNVPGSRRRSENIKWMNVKEGLLKHPVFEKVGACADELGVETYVVGGFVRDLMINRESKDIDFVCVGNGIELAKKVASSMEGRPPLSIFKNFGTAMIKIE